MPGERRWCSLGWLALVPPLAVAALVWIAGSDVPFWDEWALAPLLAKAKEGTARAADFLALHNGHQIAIPKLIMTGVALATEWNVRLQLLIDVAIACAALAAVVALSRRATPGRERALVVLGSSAAIFSFAQYENWLWAWQAAFFLTVALVAGAVAVLAVPRRSFGARFSAAGLLCALATFSSGFGWISWIALAPLVFFPQPEPGTHVRTSPWPRLAIWLGAGTLLTTASLFAGTGLDSVVRSVPDPRAFILFFFAVAGTPWTTLAIPAAILGALSIALFLAVAAGRLRADAAGSMPWIALGLFALGFGALAAYVRAREGWETGASSRYATPAALLTVAMLHLGAGIETRRRRLSFVAAAVVLVLISSLSFVPVFWSTAEGRHVTRVCTDLTFLLEPTEVECLPGRDVDSRFRDRIEIARDERLRRFADPGWFTGGGGTLEELPEGSSMVFAATGPALFSTPILATEGAARRPIALGWARDGGAWIDLPDGPAAGIIELWAMPRHEKRLVRIRRSVRRGADQRPN